MSEHPVNPQYNEAFLLTAADSIEAGMIEALLNANDIPVLKKYKESGGYIKIVMGDSIYGVDLYVPAELLDKACEIIENSREASQDDAFPYNVISEDTIDSTQVRNDPMNSENLMKNNDFKNNDGAGLAEEEQKINRKKRLVSWIIILFLMACLLVLAIILIRNIFGRN